MTDEQRVSVVAEAESWLRTPYHDHGRMKGAGADCALFPLDVYTTVLGLDAPPLPTYVMQWHLHRAEEMYLSYVRGLGAVEIAEEQLRPGDFALWRVGRVYSHGAIVTEWPKIIHAVNPRGVIRGDVSTDERLSRTQLTQPVYFTF